MSLQGIVSIQTVVMHGTPLFAGTRVPMQSLLDYLEAGDSLDAFPEDSPTVTRVQAVEFIDLAGLQEASG